MLLLLVHVTGSQTVSCDSLGSHGNQPGSHQSHAKKSRQSIVTSLYSPKGELGPTAELVKAVVLEHFNPGPPFEIVQDHNPLKSSPPKGPDPHFENPLLGFTALAFRP